MNLKQQPNLAIEPWQVEDYRSFSEEALFKKLNDNGISLDKKSLLKHMDELDAPEELTALLYQGDDFTKHEQVFLTLFELWRRLAPYKLSPSIFCDELDHLIEKYEAGEWESESKLQAALLKWLEILESHVDQEGQAKEAFVLFSEFSCHDLERFIYEYTAHQIDLENDLYASELLESFCEFVKNPRWFDFLRLRLLFDVDQEEGKVMAQRLLETLKEAPETPLLFEVLHFLIYTGELQLFATAFHSALKELRSEAELCELMMIASDYMNCIEKFSEEKELNELIEQRKKLSPKEIVNPREKVLELLKEWVVFSPPFIA